MVESGAADCVLAVGFEQMVPGALGMAFSDRKRTLDYHLSKQVEIQGWDDSVPMAAQQFGGAGVEYQRLHGTPDEVFGKIGRGSGRERVWQYVWIAGVAASLK